MERTGPDYYATLGLDRNCTGDHIRSAYRLLVKKLHPDVNPVTPDALEQTQQLNAAYEILSDPDRRRDYDSGQAQQKQHSRPTRGARTKSLAQDAHLRIDDFFRGTTLDVRVNDPGNASGAEIYSLSVPAQTAPGTRFKINRTDGGILVVRVRVRPDHRFKIRGSDLRCDLRISPERAAKGGTEFVINPTGTRLRVTIPRGIVRGEILRIDEEGLPKLRGGRGDLLVRIVYRPEVRITRASRR